MSIIAWPTCAFIDGIEWTPPDPPAQVNRSEWTGREQTTILATAGRWAANVSFENKLSEDDALEMEAFRVALKGRANSFRLPATVKPQFAVALPLQVNGGGQTGYNLAIKNGPVGAIIKRGHKLTINDQLVMNMTTVTIAGGGTATLTLSNPPRVSPTNSTAIEAVNPTCLVKLAQPGSGWSASWTEIFEFGQLQVEETF